MDRDTRTELVREVYDAYADGEHALLWSLLSPDVTFHVAGDHPLSGDYVGVEEVHGYLRTVDRAGGGPGGGGVGTVFADETGDLVLVETTTRHGTVERTIGHVLRFDGDHLVELWDNPADPEAEDRFWRLKVPVQRRPGATGGWPRAAGARAPRLDSSR